ncbi:MAG: CSLREA domain-containing protein, partial [Chloroflexi bacterium]|nr:CSLREA domain-containing protein [Chloroflexota bacterium]
MRARRLLPAWLGFIVLAALLAGPMGAPPAGAQTTTLVVTSAASTGDGRCDADCTLRDAIHAANAGSGPARIVFAIGSGPVVIRLDAPLPALTAPGTSIDGRTQPGHDGAPLIYLEGGALAAASGLESRAADVEIRALAAGGFGQFGFLVIGEAARDNRLLGNWAGLSPDGAAANPNALSGIAVVGGARGAHIGDACAGCGNRVAGNSVEGRTGHGILVGGDGTLGARVRGNVVGLGPGGRPLPNDDGILVVDGAHAIVGGVAAGEGNVVGASRVAGVELRETSALVPVRLMGNRIGLDEAGRPAPNDVGVFVNGDSAGIDVGGPWLGAGNVISANRVGVAIENRARDVRVLGNRIGLTPDGGPAPNSEDGISVIGGSRVVQVGGGGPGEGNRIVGGRNGVVIGEITTRDVRLLGNHLEGSDVGVRVSAGARITIGRAGEGRGNVVVRAAEAGIVLEGVAQVIVEGNWIGLTRDGSPGGNGVGLLLRERDGEGAEENAVRGNRIGG